MTASIAALRELGREDARLQGAVPGQPHQPNDRAARDDDDDLSAERSLADGLVQLNRDLECRTPRGFAIREADWERKLPTMARRALASGSPASNARVPTEAEIIALYREVWSGAAN